MADPLSSLLGLDGDALTWWQMGVRAISVYVAALAMVRLGEKRLLGKNTAFDVVLGVVLGSVVSRAITGQAPFWPTLFAGATLVALHWAFAWASFRAGWFGTLIKGSPRTLVTDGAIQWDAMRQSHLSREDLLSALRSEGQIDDLGDVRCARLERSGSVSVLTKRSPPRVVEVDVASGVQRVRVEIDA